MAVQTRDQATAESVFRLVSRVEGRSKTFLTEYGSMAHKLPILIRTAGLAQALAFVRADARKQSRQQLLSDLATVLARDSADDLVAASRTGNLVEYMQLTRDALSALLWFKRFAQSLLKIEGAMQDEPSSES